MLTRNEAQAAVHAALEARSRLDPIGPADLFIFSFEMSRILHFPGNEDPVADIEVWANAWLDERRRPRLLGTYFDAARRRRPPGGAYAASRQNVSQSSDAFPRSRR